MSDPEADFLIRPVTNADLPEILAVYHDCEDFLALGPVPQASMNMVLTDLAISQSAGGEFCGIFNAKRKMIGVVDFVRSGFEGNPAHAFLELLMIAAPYRSRGLGQAAVKWVEAEIRKETQVTTIFSGVQVNNPAGIAFWQKMGYRITGGPRHMPDQTTVYELQKEMTLLKGN